MNRPIIKTVVLVVVLTICLIVGFTIWASNPPTPLATAQTVLTEYGIEAQNGLLVFEPPTNAPTLGFIFYPGGRVDPRSYAPIAQGIADAGYLVIVPEMPLNLAVFDADRATEIISSYSQLTAWVIGGHSLGGSMAANYTLDYPDKVSGVVFWASYPAASDSLADLEIATLSVYGTEDGLTTVAEVEQNIGRLPTVAQFIAIEGGNHAQFGDYGVQGGDGEATISRSEQQAQAIAATVNFLAQLDE